MPDAQVVIIERDVDADAAYIRLSANPVASTVEVTPDVLVDLDDHGIAVGIEVLLLDAEIPYQRLTADFHVHSSVIEVLRRIRPSVASFLSLSSGTDGMSRVSVGQLQDA